MYFITILSKTVKLLLIECQLLLICWAEIVDIVVVTKKKTGDRFIIEFSEKRGLNLAFSSRL